MNPYIVHATNQIKGWIKWKYGSTIVVDSYVTHSTYVYLIRKTLNISHVQKDMNAKYRERIHGGYGGYNSDLNCRIG